MGVETAIPIRVFRDLDELGTSEALAWWLCEHEHGPGLTQREAAEQIGKARGTINAQIQSARRKISKDAER